MENTTQEYTMSNTPKHLFLHHGPGANCDYARALLGDRLPIHWWDQPLTFKSAETALEETAQAAQAELASLARAAGGPVGIIAHSSGGQIATLLARRAPELISRVTLIDCNTSMIDGFANLGRALAGADDKLPELARQAQREPGPATFWPLVLQVTSVPGFFDRYFHDPAARARYQAIEASCRPMDMATFQSVTNCLLTRSPALEPGTALPDSVPVNCVFGAHDPLIQIESELKAWKKVFPAARSITVEASHLPHLERPETEFRSWLQG